MINLICYDFTIITDFRIKFYGIISASLYCSPFTKDQNTSRLVLVVKQENLGPFLSTDGKISIRMVTFIFLLRGRGKYTEIMYT
jgi:hypothetical protein